MSLGYNPRYTILQQKSLIEIGIGFLQKESACEMLLEIGKKRGRLVEVF